MCPGLITAEVIRFFYVRQTVPGSRSGTAVVFTQIRTLVRVDGYAEFDEIHIGRDLAGDLVRCESKCTRGVIRRDAERVIPLVPPTEADCDLVVHDRIYRPHEPRPMLRACAGPDPDLETPLIFLYRLMWGVIRLASPLLSLGHSKVARGVAGRRAAHQLLTLWGTTLRDPDRPVVWVHAPSVGEGLQAKAVIEAIRACRPDIQVVYTFFSPSAEEFARNMAADVAAYLPWDLKGPLSRVLDALCPNALVFTKTEIWPTLVAEAVKRDVPVALVAATVPEGAGRSRPVARRLLRPAWGALTLACANSEEDAKTLRDLGVDPRAVQVTGDPGIDSAATRFDGRNRQAPWLSPFQLHDRPTVVAGSTWRADEDVLLPALEGTREKVGNLRAVIAPHEPSRRAVTRLLNRLRAAGWRAVTLEVFETLGRGDEPEDALGPDVIVVERVGVLAELYEMASVAFVGGGFHSRGLHSVLEPAAAGSPVVFGPRHRNARAAGELVREGGAEVAGDPQALAGVLTTWLTDETCRLQASSAASAYIDRHRGAAVTCATLLDPLIQKR